MFSDPPVLATISTGQDGHAWGRYQPTAYISPNGPEVE